MRFKLSAPGRCQTKITSGKYPKPFDESLVRWKINFTSDFVDDFITRS